MDGKQSGGRRDLEQELERGARSFLRVQEQYQEAREQQRRLLVRYFAGRPDFSPALRGGKGRPDYGTRRAFRALRPPYNLENWKWAQIRWEPAERRGAGGLVFVISLQPFDVDPSSGNLHTLFDRLGLYWYPAGEDVGAGAVRRMMVTDISLPLDRGKLEKLERLLRDVAELHGAWRERGLDQILS